MKQITYKKKNSPSGHIALQNISITAPGQKQRTRTLSPVSFAVFFVMFLFASLGFQLCVQGVFLARISWKNIPVWLVGSCILSCILLSLKFQIPCFLLYLFSYGVLLCIFLFLFRQDFSDSLASCADYLVREAENLYIFGQPASSGMEQGSPNPCLIFLLLFFQYLLLNAAGSGKKWFFFLLLCIPLAFAVSFDQPPSFAALGFLLSAFLLWDCCFLKGPAQAGKLFSVFAVLALYALCFHFLAPSVSPRLFSAYPSLNQAVNSLGSSLFSSVSSGTDFFPDSTSKDQSSYLSRTHGGFSYETVSDRQSLTNASPSYTGQTMFTLESDQELTAPLYLRGFVGASYSDALWTGVSDSLWQPYARQTHISGLTSLYNLPYQLGKEEHSPADLRLYRQFHNAYHYFPYGASLPFSVQVTESNQVFSNASDTSAFSWIPLTLQDSGFLFSGDSTLPSLDLRSMENTYSEYVQDLYTLWDAEGLEELYEAVSSFSSFPLSAEPSYEEICEAVADIQEYLWNQASYSLSLSDTGGEDASFVYDFLYRRQEGFCIHFATAGTLMCRMMGIPARYVTGYTVHPDNADTAAPGTYRYLVPDSSAHAWTEIYIGEGGWVPVEMTPSAASSDPVSGSSPQQTENLSQEQKEESSEETSSSEDSPNGIGGAGADSPSGVSIRPGKVFLSAAAVLACLAVVFFLLLILRVLRFRKRMGYFASSEPSCYLTVFQSLLKLWQLCYHLPFDSLDAGLILKSDKKIPPDTRDLFVSLYAQAEEFSFSSRTPSQKDIRFLRQTYLLERKKLLASCSFWKKIYLFLLKGF